MTSVESQRATSLSVAAGEDGWAAFQSALAALDRADHGAALVLLAEAETLSRAAGDAAGEWRALLAQSVAHRRAGEHGLAVARARAAAHAAARGAGDGAVGLACWQLAAAAIEQADYDAGAEWLRQAQAALEPEGLAPAAGALVATAQLCAEIGRWRHVAAEHGPAAQTVAAVRRDLDRQLGETARQIRELYARRSPAEPFDLLCAPPVARDHSRPPGPSLAARVARWWRVLVSPGAELPATPTTPAAAERLPSPPPAEELGGAQSSRSSAAPGTPPEAAPSRQTALAPPAAPSATEHTAVEMAPAPGAPPDAAPRSQPIRLQSATPPARRGETRPAHRAGAHVGLAVSMLGDLRVFYNDTPIESWESARARAIFRYLVAQRPAAAPKERLATLLWPDSEPELARRSLHQAIYCLRQTLRRYAGDVPIIQFANDTYQIAPDIPIWVDADVFAAQIAAGRAHWSAGDAEAAVRAYATAADLYTGDFLASEGAEEWAEERRGAYQVMYAEALHRLAQHYYERGDTAAAVVFSQRALAHDGCDEDAHRMLMLCYAAQGLRHLAVRQYQLCVATVRSQLGLDPSDEMKELYRRLVG